MGCLFKDEFFESVFFFRIICLLFIYEVENKGFDWVFVLFNFVELFLRGEVVVSFLVIGKVFVKFVVFIFCLYREGMDVCINGLLVGIIDVVFGFKCDKFCLVELMYGESVILCLSVDIIVVVFVVIEDVIIFDDFKKISCCEVDEVGIIIDFFFIMSGMIFFVFGCFIKIIGGLIGDVFVVIILFVCFDFDSILVKFGVILESLFFWMEEFGIWDLFIVDIIESEE